jgi:hypothetical protein
MTELRQVFSTPDGQTFSTKAEAMAHLRRPKILAALKAVTGGRAELGDWLLANQETVENAFETGTIRRVTKSETKRLEKACEALKGLDKGIHKDLLFLIESADAVKESFRWPSVKRMDDEAKAVAARNTLMLATENNGELVDWILAQKDAILESYKAGVEKRQVNPKAQDALAAYRQKKADEKAALAAGGKSEEEQAE